MVTTDEQDKLEFVKHNKYPNLDVLYHKLLKFIKYGPCNLSN